MIVSREVGDVVILDLPEHIRRGDEEGPTLVQCVTAELDMQKRKFIFNFENVRSVDDVGIGEILASYVSIRNFGGRLKFACLSSKLCIMFKVGMISPPWLAGPGETPPFETVEAALRSFD